MLDTNSQSQAARVTAEFVRAWTLAATTPAIQTMRFWTRLLSPTAVTAAAASSEPEASDEMTDVPAPSDGREEIPEQAPVAEDTANEPGFSSYRSSGGHAVAQVIVQGQA